MGKVFRCMRADDDGYPIVQQRAERLGWKVAESLGVRVGSRRTDDIDVAAEGEVIPGTGGMSVFDDPWLLPEYRLPPSFGGTSNCEVFSVDTELLPPELVATPAEANGHSVIEPSRRCSLAEYQTALANTRGLREVEHA